MRSLLALSLVISSVASANSFCSFNNNSTCMNSYAHYPFTTVLPTDVTPVRRPQFPGGAETSRNCNVDQSYPSPQTLIYRYEEFAELMIAVSPDSVFVDPTLTDNLDLIQGSVVVSSKQAVELTVGTTRVALSRKAVVLVEKDETGYSIVDLNDYKKNTVQIWDLDNPAKKVGLSPGMAVRIEKDKGYFFPVSIPTVMAKHPLVASMYRVGGSSEQKMMKGMLKTAAILCHLGK